MLTSPCGRLDLTRLPADTSGRSHWLLASRSPHRDTPIWFAEFDDQVPSEIISAVVVNTAVLLNDDADTIAYGTKAVDMPTEMVQAVGWGTYCGGLDFVSVARDTAAALYHSDRDPDMPMMLSAGPPNLDRDFNDYPELDDEHRLPGHLWSATISRQAPEPVLLTFAAAASGRFPVLRRRDELPQAHHARTKTTALPKAGPGLSAVTPRHLAGPASQLERPGLVSRYSWPHFTNSERAVITSPCGRLRVGVDFSPARWRILAAESASAPTDWSAEFSAGTPQEIVEDVLDALAAAVHDDSARAGRTALDPGVTLTGQDVHDALDSTGWRAQASENGIIAIADDARSIVTIRNRFGYQGRDPYKELDRPLQHAGMTIRAMAGTGWHATFSEGTPAFLLRAAAQALTSADPVQRDRQSLPLDVIPHLRTIRAPRITRQNAATARSQHRPAASAQTTTPQPTAPAGAPRSGLGR
ncbi:hypothetical protein P3T36_003380 [Kitasatospora sp. MAP12-15]|uniref:DUF317 domain-containing protein n=1 Tax=unclassified Kitasatospora TaxID=2633591 RepID=UPI0024771B80|nr:DUF317 domain-containing protein [Kitasatospora sp. MAP12-44]MDH6111357.1 hypothetical protein [Kitasatospora sp. MAP12-44]